MRSQKMHFKLKCNIPFQGQWCTSMNKQNDELPNTVSMGNAAMLHMHKQQTDQLPNTVSRHAYSTLQS